MMKRLSIFMLIGLVLASCTESYDSELGLFPTLTPRYLSISPTAINFPSSKAEDAQLSINSTQTPWRIENSADWLSFSTNSGTSSTSLTAHVNENIIGDVARTAISYFKADVNDWAYEKAISVTQAGAEPVIDLSASQINLSAVAGSSETVTVTSNCDWEVESATSWLTISKSDNNVKISASANTDSKYREGSVQVVHKGNKNVTKTIVVSQALASITASSESVSFENVASSAVISIISEAPWSVSTSNSWIDVSPTSGDAGNSSFTINVSPNTSVSERNGFVVLNVGTTQRIQIPITQKGIYIECDTKSLSFIAGPSVQSVTIKSNTSWQLISAPEWIRVNPSEGNGRKDISISVVDNPNTTPRSGTIHISQQGVSLDVAISVTQSGKSFELGASSLTFEDKQETLSFQIETDGSWTATTSNDWITLPTKSGNGSSMIPVTVSENTAGKERKGQVFVTVGDKTLTLRVIQKGKYVEMGENVLNFPASASTHNLEIRSNATWSIGSKPDWISVDITNGSGSKTIKVIAADNPNTSARSGQLHIIQEGMNLDIVVALTQAGKMFEIGATVLDFNDKQETKNITITTDGTWSASSDDSWITVSPSSYSGNSTLSITVTENITASDRTGNIKVTLGDKTSTIQINQKGKFFTVTSDQLNYPSKGGDINITLSTNDVWTATIENGDSWLSLSQTSGSDNAVVKLTAKDNPSVNTRSGSIVFTSRSHQSVRFNVTQSARYLTVDTQQLLFYSKGGTSNVVTISTDAQYTVTGDASWLSIAQSSNTFTVTASENKTEDPRFAKVIIAMTDLQEGTYKLELQVTQLNYGGTFIRTDFGQDQDWNGHGSGATNTTLVIKPFGTDGNWDNASTSSTTLFVGGFTSDKNWDNQSSSGVTIVRTGYSADKNYDNVSSSNGNLSRKDFDNDTNWQ